MAVGERMRGVYMYRALLWSLLQKYRALVQKYRALLWTNTCFCSAAVGERMRGVYIYRALLWSLLQKYRVFGRNIGLCCGRYLLL